MNTAAANARQVDVTNEENAGIALRAFFGIAEEWKLTTEEQMKLLGSPPRSTFFKWKKAGASLSSDTFERLSYVFGIYKAIQILIPGREAANEWLRKPNAATIFGGGSALDRMLGGRVSDLFVVRRYLDAQRGG